MTPSRLPRRFRISLLLLFVWIGAELPEGVHSIGRALHPRQKKETGLPERLSRAIRDHVPEGEEAVVLLPAQRPDEIELLWGVYRINRFVFPVRVTYLFPAEEGGWRRVSFSWESVGFFGAEGLSYDPVILPGDYPRRFEWWVRVAGEGVDPEGMDRVLSDPEFVLLRRKKASP